MSFCYEIATQAALRTFARTLTTLVKIGDELYLEPSPSHLTLRILNAGRSAHVVFNFQGPFFERKEYSGALVPRSSL